MDKDHQEAYKELRQKELELYQQGLCVCDSCGEIVPETAGFASATYGWLCFVCQGRLTIQPRYLVDSGGKC